MRLAAIGDNCIDIYINLGMAFPGGGAVNFAVYARQAGAETTYIGVVGQDPAGDWMGNALWAEGVEISHLTRAVGPTAVAYVYLADTERTFVGGNPGVRGQLKVTSELAIYLLDYDLVHTTLDGGVDAHISSWHRAGKRISYDFSHRARPEQFNLLPYLYIAFFSGQNISQKEAPGLLLSYRQRGAHLVVMTFGADGSLAYDGERFYHQQAMPALVVDTLGAGDAFQAGFVVSYLKTNSVPAALAFGAQVAARACTHYGAFGHGRNVSEDDNYPEPKGF